MSEFRHDCVAARFEVTIDGTPAGFASYRLADGVTDFDHAEVPPGFGGRRVAARLVQLAMEGARAAGEWRVRASCPYVGRWFGQHTEYAELLA